MITPCSKSLSFCVGPNGALAVLVRESALAMARYRGGIATF